MQLLKHTKSHTLFCQRGKKKTNLKYYSPTSRWSPPPVPDLWSGNVYFKMIKTSLCFAVLLMLFCSSQELRFAKVYQENFRTGNTSRRWSRHCPPVLSPYVFLLMWSLEGSNPTLLRTKAKETASEAETGSDWSHKCQIEIKLSKAKINSLLQSPPWLRRVLRHMWGNNSPCSGPLLSPRPSGSVCFTSAALFSSDNNWKQIGSRCRSNWDDMAHQHLGWTTTSIWSEWEYDFCTNKRENLS